MGKKKGGKGGAGQEGQPQQQQQQQQQQQPAFAFNFAPQGTAPAGAGRGTGHQSVFDLAGADANVADFMRGRLGQLIGKSSGYLETLPAVVQDRVRALKHLQSKKAELDKQLRKEQEELEKKYTALFAPCTTDAPTS